MFLNGRIYLNRGIGDPKLWEFVKNYLFFTSDLKSKIKEIPFFKSLIRLAPLSKSYPPIERAINSLSKVLEKSTYPQAILLSLVFMWSVIIFTWKFLKIVKTHGYTSFLPNFYNVKNEIFWLTRCFLRKLLKLTPPKKTIRAEKCHLWYAG